VCYEIKVFVIFRFHINGVLYLSKFTECFIQIVYQMCYIYLNPFLRIRIFWIYLLLFKNWEIWIFEYLNILYLSLLL
jgi:hypothetical protein